MNTGHCCHSGGSLKSQLSLEVENQRSLGVNLSCMFHNRTVGLYLKTLDTISLNLYSVSELEQTPVSSHVTDIS